MENKCQWHFREEGGRDIGPNDPIEQSFKGQPYYSIVRESIQNSLDAVKDENSPVTVDFSFFELTRKEYPNFFSIEEHINQSASYFSENDNAKWLFSEMQKYLNGDSKREKREKLSCLRISDYNTKGMSYNANDTTSPFYAFLRAGGVSAKGSQSGGSFGFGKGAYYTLSPIKTIVVSTRDEKNKVFFEGSTILTTHKNSSGKKLTAFGYYDNNRGEPTTEEEKIPKSFRRNTIGTDISIIGIWDVPDQKTIMIKSVLNNFWYAIHSGKLVVKIDQVTINKDNLERTISQFYPDEIEKHALRDFEAWNPKPYFKAVKYAGKNDQFILFTKNLITLGEVKLYVYLEKGLPNRTAFFRKPKMTVYKQTIRKIAGYAAVFICESYEGNDILRKMENPAHNQWASENYPKEEGKTANIATKAAREVRDFVNDMLDSLSKISTGKKMTFLELEDYLSIPEDLLEKDEDSDRGGDNETNNAENISNDTSSEETGSLTTNKNSPIRIKATFQQKNKVLEEENVDANEDGEFIITSDEDEEGGGEGDGQQAGAKGTGIKGGLTDYETESRIIREVKLKVAAEKEKNLWYHNLMVNSASEIKHAELELFVGSDNNKDDGVEIIATDHGEFSGNKIVNLSLAPGINKIKVQFAGNLRHSIKMKAYEIQ